ncbi:hypothetical protein HDK64DRAFT_97994 [Phyllosticta capitalensis]
MIILLSPGVLEPVKTRLRVYQQNSAVDSGSWIARARVVRYCTLICICPCFGSSAQVPDQLAVWHLSNPCLCLFCHRAFARRPHLFPSARLTTWNLNNQGHSRVPPPWPDLTCDDRRPRPFWSAREQRPPRRGNLESSAYVPRPNLTCLAKPNTTCDTKHVPLLPLSTIKPSNPGTRRCPLPGRDPLLRHAHHHAPEIATFAA